jgi:CheY-like chemotaxis protein
MGAKLPFDAVLLDLTIPGGMGGRETLDALKKKDPRVAAIASSGYSNAPVLANPKAFGFDACLAKPYTIVELGRIMREVIPGQPLGENKHEKKCG